MDLAFWLNQNVAAPDATTKHTAMATIVTGWFQEESGEFGLAGYAPDFLRSWWEDRLDNGSLEGTPTAARFTEKATARMFLELPKIPRVEN